MNLIKYLIFFSLFYYLIMNSADSKCQEFFQCGNLGSLKFPFTDLKNPRCGLFMVDGCDSTNPRVQLDSGFSYDILQKVSTNKFLIIDPRLQNQLRSNSCNSFTNQSPSRSPFISFTVSPVLTLFTCSNQSYSEPIQYYFENYNHTTCPFFTVYYRNPATRGVPVTGEISGIPSECSMMHLPMKSNQDSSELFNLLTYKYILEWNVSEACYQCHSGGGQCLSNNKNEFYCRKGNKRFKKIFLTGAVSMTALTSTSIILFLFIRRKDTLLKLLGLQEAKSADEKDIELFLKNNGNLSPRYKYSEIKKMTNSFSENLGKGGYGSVYKGKLPDGRFVAVKILNESKGNGEEFMNEVASIIRTSHINIVTLMGFCFEGSKRALIYDFMPNGSLEKFIQNTASSSAEGGLGWQKLFEIALGIARGLEYLHQGCNTRILHFDIKPHNILLDKDLNPRISDFGLAKLCPNRSSIVSMLVARGTIGYIAPEVFCRNFGEVSYKSDVYSYGMMVLEIAGGRKNTSPESIEHMSEIYLPRDIYKQLEMEVERGNSLAGIMSEDESQFTKLKLMIVGLWCIQTDPKDRPSMTKVVELLEGKLESLQIPPKPYLFTPRRSAPNFSISELM